MVRLAQSTLSRFLFDTLARIERHAANDGSVVEPQSVEDEPSRPSRHVGPKTKFVSCLSRKKGLTANTFQVRVEDDWQRFKEEGRALR